MEVPRSAPIGFARARGFNLRLFWLACSRLYRRVALDALVDVRFDAPSAGDCCVISARDVVHFNEKCSFLITRTIFPGSTDSGGDMTFLKVVIGAKRPLSENGQLYAFAISGAACSSVSTGVTSQSRHSAHSAACS